MYIHSKSLLKVGQTYKLSSSQCSGRYHLDRLLGSYLSYQQLPSLHNHLHHALGHQTHLLLLPSQQSSDQQSMYSEINEKQRQYFADNVWGNCLCGAVLWNDKDV